MSLHGRSSGYYWLIWKLIKLGLSILFILALVGVLLLAYYYAEPQGFVLK